MADKIIIGVDAGQDGDYSAVTFAHLDGGVIVIDDVEAGSGPEFAAFLEYVLPAKRSERR